MTTNLREYRNFVGGAFHARAAGTWAAPADADRVALSGAILERMSEKP